MQLDGLTDLTVFPWAISDLENLRLPFVRTLFPTRLLYFTPRACIIRFRGLRTARETHVCMFKLAKSSTLVSAHIFDVWSSSGALQMQ